MKLHQGSGGARRKLTPQTPKLLPQTFKLAPLQAVSVAFMLAVT